MTDFNHLWRTVARAAAEGRRRPVDRKSVTHTEAVDLVAQDFVEGRK